jgi:hypothetical protein
MKGNIDAFRHVATRYTIVDEDAVVIGVSLVAIGTAVVPPGVLLAAIDTVAVPPGVLLAIGDVPGVTVAVVATDGILPSRIAIRSRRTLICWLRLSYRLLRVPRVAAARANVIIPNRPIIPNVINTGILADPAPAINTYLIEKSNSRFC